MRIDVAVTCPACGGDVAGGAHYCAACGTGQPGRLPASPDPVDMVDPRVTPPLLPTQPSATSLLIAVTLVVLLVIVTVPVLVMRTLFFGPDDAVRNYFSALAARDPDAALVQLEPNAGRGNLMLTRAALAAPGYQPPAAFDLSNVTVKGADAVATVQYTVNGQRMTDQIKVHRGRATNLFQRWHVRDGLLPVSVRVPQAAHAQLGGVVVDAGEYDVFPGTYVLSLAPDPLLTAGPVTVVAGVADESGGLSLGLKDTARAAIDQQVRGYIDQCAKSTSLSPPAGCPFSYDSYGYYEPVRWKVLSYPELRETVDDNGQVTVSAQSPGTIRLTGGSGSYASPSTYTFTVAGTAAAAGGTVTFTPQQ
jgi:hypothetical protein